MFPDPEAFNPLRWLEPQYPTYKEPLTQFPTLLNSSQFGYGRRTCQGQTVTEADLLVGIGSIAWMFDMKKQQSVPEIAIEDSPPSTPVMQPSRPCTPFSRVDSGIGMSPATEREKLVWTNFKASLSVEEFNAGISVHSLDADEQDEYEMQLPGAFPQPTAEERAEEFMAQLEKERKVEEAQKAKDPTLDFTPLLIAKPTPFKFEMSPRNMQRAEKVVAQFHEKKEAGEFKDARQYWGPEQGKGRELGWQKV